MKKLTFTLVLGLFGTSFFQAQTVSTLEELTLPENSYWDGSSNPSGTSFTNGHVIYPNFFEPSFGGYWAEGWAYSNKTDNTTPGFLNIFSAITGGGVNGSSNYALGQNGAVLNFTPEAFMGSMDGFFVTNSTYAALSMRDGDDYAKKFGGQDGTDPDWFKLTVTAWLFGSPKEQTVEFYLADFRFPDSDDDYIVTDWRWVDLTSLGIMDSLQFELSSTDNDPQFGMNTPAFFCIDNFTTMDDVWSVKEQVVNPFKVFPNPANETLHISLTNAPDNQTSIQILDLNGRFITQNKLSNTFTSINLNELNSGTYFLNFINNTGVYTEKFTKK